MRASVLACLLLAILLLGCIQPTAEDMAKNVQKMETKQPRQKVVYFFYLTSCSNCEEVKPYIQNLTKIHPNVKFVFCNVYNCSDECKAIRKNVSLMGVPAVVVIDDKTTVLLGSKEIVEKLDEVLNEK